MIDIWALGVIVHEMLTLRIPFLDPYTDPQSDLTLSFATAAEQNIDTAQLYEYCKGAIPFPCDSLQKASVSADGIDFVKSLLVVNPAGRASAVVALASQWVQSRSASQLDKPDVSTTPGPSRSASSSDTVKKEKADHGQIRDAQRKKSEVYNREQQGSKVKIIPKFGMRLRQQQDLQTDGMGIDNVRVNMTRPGYKSPEEHNYSSSNRGGYSTSDKHVGDSSSNRGGYSSSDKQAGDSSHKRVGYRSSEKQAGDSSNNRDGSKISNIRAGDSSSYGYGSKSAKGHSSDKPTNDSSNRRDGYSSIHRAGDKFSNEQYHSYATPTGNSPSSRDRNSSARNRPADYSSRSNNTPNSSLTTTSTRKHHTLAASPFKATTEAPVSTSKREEIYEAVDVPSYDNQPSKEEEKPYSFVVAMAAAEAISPVEEDGSKETDVQMDDPMDIDVVMQDSKKEMDVPMETNRRTVHAETAEAASYYPGSRYSSPKPIKPSSEEAEVPDPEPWDPYAWKYVPDSLKHSSSMEGEAAHSGAEECTKKSPSPSVRDEMNSPIPMEIDPFERPGWKASRNKVNRPISMEAEVTEPQPEGMKDQSSSRRDTGQPQWQLETPAKPSQNRSPSSLGPVGETQPSRQATGRLPPSIGTPMEAFLPSRPPEINERRDYEAWETQPAQDDRFTATRGRTECAVIQNVVAMAPTAPALSSPSRPPDVPHGIHRRGSYGEMSNPQNTKPTGTSGGHQRYPIDLENVVAMGPTTNPLSLPPGAQNIEYEGRARRGGPRSEDVVKTYPGDMYHSVTQADHPGTRQGDLDYQDTRPGRARPPRGDSPNRMVNTVDDRGDQFLEDQYSTSSFYHSNQYASQMPGTGRGRGVEYSNGPGVESHAYPDNDTRYAQVPQAPTLSRQDSYPYNQRRQQTYWSDERPQQRSSYDDRPQQTSQYGDHPRQASPYDADPYRHNHDTGPLSPVGGAPSGLSLIPPFVPSPTAIGTSTLIKESQPRWRHWVDGLKEILHKPARK